MYDTIRLLLVTSQATPLPPPTVCVSIAALYAARSHIVCATRHSHTAAVACLLIAITITEALENCEILARHLCPISSETGERGDAEGVWIVRVDAEGVWIVHHQQQLYCSVQSAICGCFVVVYIKAN